MLALLYLIFIVLPEKAAAITALLSPSRDKLWVYVKALSVCFRPLELVLTPMYLPEADFMVYVPASFLAMVNVAASTDGLCNAIFELAAGVGHINIPTDVWTVFDIIFTSVSVLGIALFIASMVTKKKGFLIGTGSALLLLSVLIFILFPVIFGAGFKEIAFVWAPWSFITGFIILVTDVVCTAIKLIVVKADEGRTKTG